MKPFFPILCISTVLLLSSCANRVVVSPVPSPSTSSSSSASVEPEVSVSFFIPPDYKYARGVSRGVLQFRDQPIQFHSVGVTQDRGGETAMITAMWTRDPRILEYAVAYSPLESVTVDGIQMQRYKFVGMGDVVGYIRREGKTFVLVQFTFPPSEDVMRQVVTSVETMGDE
ncbi:MAG: hypothetical protein WCV62_00960 [Candidatus Peribacteraceae bacterium]